MSDDGTAVGIEQQVTERIIAHLTNRIKDVRRVRSASSH